MLIFHFPFYMINGNLDMALRNNSAARENNKMIRKRYKALFSSLGDEETQSGFSGAPRENFDQTPLSRNENNNPD